MSIYTVHVPDGAADQLSRADRTVFIREGFNVWAFLFGPAFMVRHRLWIECAIWLFLMIGGGWFLSGLRFPLAASVALLLVVALALGVEGNALRRWKLDRRGYRFADVISGEGREEAELIFFSKLPAKRPDPRAATVRAPVSETTPAVIGMFPEGSGS